MIKPIAMVLAAMLAALSPVSLWPASAWAADSLHNKEESRPQAHRSQATPQSKPQVKPKAKTDKDKNCQWGHDVVVDVEYKHITMTQDDLKKVISGAESSINGYRVYANPRKLVLLIRSPEGFWYSAALMRIGSLDEGCLFYSVGTAIQLPEEPPL